MGHRVDHPAVRALLAHYPTPTAISQAGRDDFVVLLTEHAPRMGQRLVDDVRAAVASQAVTVPAEATLGRVVAELAGELDRLHTRRDQLAGEFEAVFSAHPLGPVLATLPGVGRRTGAKILAEIGDGIRFATGAQIAAYAGLAPVTRQSGSSVRGETQSRRGTHRLKNAMFLAARRLPAIAGLQGVLRPHTRRGQAPQRRRICLARRRCDVILAMLKTATPTTPPGRQARPKNPAPWRLDAMKERDPRSR